MQNSEVVTLLSISFLILRNNDDVLLSDSYSSGGKKLNFEQCQIVWRMDTTSRDVCHCVSFQLAEECAHNLKQSTDHNAFATRK